MITYTLLFMSKGDLNIFSPLNPISTILCYLLPSRNMTCFSEQIFISPSLMGDKCVQCQTFATLIVCCSIASCMLALSCSRMLLNSSIQHNPPSDNTRAPASNCHSPPSCIQKQKISSVSTCILILIFKSSSDAPCQVSV